MENKQKIQDQLHLKNGMRSELGTSGSLRIIGILFRFQQSWIWGRDSHWHYWSGELVDFEIDYFKIKRNADPFVRK